MDKTQAKAFADAYLDNHKNELTQDVAELIKIRSVKSDSLPSMPFGKGVYEALACALNQANRLGFETKNLDNYIGWADYGKEGELVEADSFAIMAHVDVVPEGTGWRVDPYGAVIEGSLMIGRGTLDDKGPAVASLYALAAVKESVIPLKKKVRLIFGCDEESGWADIQYYKQHEKLPGSGISPDGDFPLVNSEKGILHFAIDSKFATSAGESKLLSIKGGTRPNVVPPEATAIVTGCPIEAIEAAVTGFEQETNTVVALLQKKEETYITVKGFGAHASTPEKGVNAVTALIKLLQKLPLSPCAGLDALNALTKRIPFGEFGGESAGVACKDDKSGALTLSLGIFELDEESLHAVVDIRYPVSYCDDHFMGILTETLAPFRVEAVSLQDPHYVDENSPLVQTLLRVYAEKSGLEPYCIAIGGGTYARAIEGAVTFGAAFPGSLDLAHQPNEVIDLNDLLLTAKIIASAIIEICA